MLALSLNLLEVQWNLGPGLVPAHCERSEVELEDRLVDARESSRCLELRELLLVLVAPGEKRPADEREENDASRIASRKRFPV